jgi:basic membrane lipoprotein Med (substrate-binding protein (PBP1-ABC) superfamily)
MRQRAKRTTGCLMVAALAAVLLVATASPGGASVAAKNKKFCKAVSKISSSVQNDSGNGLDQSYAESAAKRLNKAANSAPSKVKSALKTMASSFQAIADADNKVDAAKAAASLATGSKYSKAVLTFVKYYTKNCVTLPSVPTTS